MKFHVCGIDTLMETIFRNKVTHVLSLIEKEVTVDLSKCFSVQEHKIINFRDVWAKDAAGAPTIEQCKEILDWGDTLPEDAVVLVHCYAGISRSTCATLALMYQRGSIRNNENHQERRELVLIRPIAFPNTLMAEYFDQLLVAYGAFKRDVEVIRENSPFALSLKQV